MVDPFIDYLFVVFLHSPTLFPRSKWTPKLHARKIEQKLYEMKFWPEKKKKKTSSFLAWKNISILISNVVVLGIPEQML